MLPFPAAILPPEKLSPFTNTVPLLIRLKESLLFLKKINHTRLRAGKARSQAGMQMEQCFHPTTEIGGGGLGSSQSDLLILLHDLLLSCGVSLIKYSHLQRVTWCKSHNYPGEQVVQGSLPTRTIMGKAARIMLGFTRVHCVTEVRRCRTWLAYR